MSCIRSMKTKHFLEKQIMNRKYITNDFVVLYHFCVLRQQSRLTLSSADNSSVRRALGAIKK